MTDLPRWPCTVVLGGGTGMPVVLGALKNETPHLTAIVAMSDDGGSSGRLRDDFDVLPPGDIRNCLAALAEDKTLLSELFQYRFRGSGELNGHSLGNLFLTALSELAGGFDRAILLASRVLAIRGRVLPVTLDKIRLKANLANGEEIIGESKISRSRSRIREVTLISEKAPQAAPGVLDNLERAEVILLGPGSLFTSLIPTLLIPGVAQTIRQSGAVKIYIANLMTQPGETDGFTLEDHLKALENHAGERFIDAILVNSEAPDPEALKRYAQAGAVPVSYDRGSVGFKNISLFETPLRSAETLVRHDPQKLLMALKEVVQKKHSPFHLKEAFIQKETTR